MTERWFEILLVPYEHDLNQFKKYFYANDIIPLSRWTWLEGIRVDMVWYTDNATQHPEWENARERALLNLRFAKDLTQPYLFSRFRNIDLVPDIARRYHAPEFNSQ